MAVEVVAACHRAEHRAGVDEPRDAGLRQAVLAARDGVPDDEMPAPVRDVEEDTRPWRQSRGRVRLRSG